MSRLGRLQRWAAELPAKVRYGWKRHPKTAFLLASTLLVFCILWVVLLCVDLATWKPWIETLNGATWPEHWDQVWCKAPIRFAGAVALRSTINFAGAVSVVSATIWFFLGGLERYMHMTQIELLRLFNAEVVSAMIGVLERNGIKIDEKVESEMLETADNFAESFVKDAKKASKEDDDTEG